MVLCVLKEGHRNNVILQRCSVYFCYQLRCRKSWRYCWCFQSFNVYIVTLRGKWYQKSNLGPIAPMATVLPPGYWGFRMGTSSSLVISDLLTSLRSIVEEWPTKPGCMENLHTSKWGLNHRPLVQCKATDQNHWLLDCGFNKTLYRIFYHVIFHRNPTLLYGR